MTTLPATLSTLNQQISALTEKLAPIGADHVSEAVASLITAGLIFPASIKAEDAPAVYSFALANVSAHGLRRVVSKLIRGEYDNINRAFIPTPPEMAAMARAETRTIVDDVARLKAKRDAMEAPTGEKRDPAMVERIKAKLRDFREQDAARRAINTIPQEPMSDEKAEYYRKIMDIKDTRPPSAEQMAYRRKIIRDIEDVHTEERKAAE